MVLGWQHLPNQQEVMVLRNTLLKLQLKDCLQFKRKMKARTEQGRTIRLREGMKSPPSQRMLDLLSLDICKQGNRTGLHHGIYPGDWGKEEEKGTVIQTELAQKHTSINWT